MNEEQYTGRAAAYAAHRPDYPGALHDALFAEAGLRPGMAVADVGAGTGIFARGLLARGCRVHAVEPNGDMRAEAAARLGDRPGFAAVDGSAEATGLPDGSVEAVAAAQAFHWFDAARFAAECRRILASPEAPVILAGYHFVGSAPVLRALGEVNRVHFAPTAAGSARGPTPAGDREFAAFYRDGRYVRREFPFVVEDTEEQLVGASLSTAGAPRPGDAAHAGYVEAVRGLFRRFAAGGRLDVPMVAWACWGAVAEG